MIFDETVVFTLSALAATPIALSTGLPLGGSGAGADGLSSLLGEGQQLLAEFEVTESFATSTNAGALLGVVLADNAALSTNAIFIGVCPLTLVILNAHFIPCLSTLDLQLGARHHCAVSPHSRALTVGGGGTPTVPLNKLYVGAGLFVPNYFDGGSNSFTAGAVKMRLTLGVQANSHLDRVVASRMKVV